MWRYALMTVAFFAHAPTFADDANNARSIILESIKAHGGKAALKKVAISRKSGTAQSGDELERIEYVYACDLPSRTVSHVSFFSDSGNSTYSYYLNGKQLSVFVNGVKLPTVDGLWEAKEEAEYVSYLSLLYPLLETKGIQLTKMDDQIIAGHDCRVVRATVKNRPRSITFFFDKRTDLNIGMDVGDKLPSRSLYSDLREFDGLKYYSVIRCIREGKVVREEVIKKLEFLDKIDDSEFEGPPKR